MVNRYAFEPDYPVAPGATLKETLETKGLSQSDLAIRTGLAEKTISQIVNGIAPISFDTAEKLELATGVPATFWNRMELSYREAMGKKEESERMSADAAWLKEIPIKELIERSFIEASQDKGELVRRTLKFFGVSSVQAWRNVWGDPSAQFRGKIAKDKYPGYVASWLRMGDARAEAINTEPFDAAEFKRALGYARTVTGLRAAEWKPKTEEAFAKAGIILVFVKEIPRAGVSGATRWVTKDRAMIQLSLKYKTDDQLWFTLFHEAGHILLHSKKALFVEFGSDNNSSLEEQEANAFARDILIPPDQCHKLPYLRNRAQIRAFARTIGIAPGIVVGRLQHDGLCYKSAFNDLKKKMKWA